ncbi:hypothetical protein [Flavobacterium sp.]|uniref:hypothetical protein n=1 Tax=Flavobacterium sp. TaxID=239 RepID=UPI00286D5505|nr:hypothetical protein [Flavobacterium sp.]
MKNSQKWISIFYTQLNYITFEILNTKMMANNSSNTNFNTTTKTLVVTTVTSTTTTPLG